MSRLKEQYQNEIVDAMIKKFGYKNIMEVPKLEKIVVNMGVGEAKENAKLLEAAIKDMEAITGQKVVATKAKHAKPSMQNQQGGIIHQEGPVDISNVLYLHKGTPTRVGFKMDGDKKVRVAKATGEVID